MSETALKHIEHLSAAIGPRGTATEKEREAHQYVERTLAELGYDPKRDDVPVPVSAYQPFILALVLMLVAVFLFYAAGGAGALAAAILGAVVTASTLMELTLKDNPLRWFLPVAPSQNTYALAAPDGEARKKIVVVAHVDTHRTPLIWATPGWFAAYRVLSTLGIIALPAGTILFITGIFVTSDLLRQVALGLAVVNALLLAVVLQAEFTKYSPGANDNASGVGVLLALAARLKREPLAQAEVWLLADTAEETGAFGLRDFVRRHKEELEGATFLVVDNVAGKDTGPCYLRSETFLLPLRYPGDLLDLAGRVAADHPELGAYTWAMQGAYTDAAIALKAGFKALTMLGYTKHGWIPDWHRPTDKFDRVDGGAVARTEQFMWEVMRQLDRS